MPWDSGNWDEGSWDDDATFPPSLYPHFQPKHTTTMKRQNYYPSRIGDQANWHDNFATKIGNHATNLTLDPAEVTARVADAKWCHYVLGTWLTAVRAFSPSTTDAVDLVLTGVPDAENNPAALPTFTAPALGGVVPQPPGALLRIFNFIAQIKRKASFTDVIGSDLRVIGSEFTEKNLPKLTARVIQGTTHQVVRLNFAKYTHQGVYFESRRGVGGTWEFLTIDTEDPYVDERPLLTASQPEVREYRARFWDKGTPNGEWTDVATVTVGL